MASEIESRIDGERRAEKTKSELITNVSHDLRTPLTSVMGYIGLIKHQRNPNTGNTQIGFLNTGTPLLRPGKGLSNLV